MLIEILQDNALVKCQFGVYNGIESSCRSTKTVDDPLGEGSWRIYKLCAARTCFLKEIEEDCDECIMILDGSTVDISPNEGESLEEAFFRITDAKGGNRHV